MKVLIIEDSLVMRMIIERLLRESHLGLDEVLHAANGAEALALLWRMDGTAPDLILCDVNMPVMDGLSFLLERKRLKLAEGVPVIMITAEGTDPDVHKAIAEDAQGYISKPFTVKQMQSRVISLLRLAQ